MVQSWEGAVSKHEFSHPVYANDSYTFSWAFQKASLSDFDILSNLLESDVARIFSVNVTNTIGIQFFKIDTIIGIINKIDKIIVFISKRRC